MSSLEDARNATTDASGRIREITGQLHALIQQVDEALNASQNSQATTDEAASMLETIGVIDAEPARQAAEKLTESAGGLQQAKSVLEETAGQITATGQITDEALALIQQAMGLLAGTSSPADPGSPGSGPAVARVRRIDGFKPARPNRDAVGEVRKLGWPKNSAGRTSACGHLYGPDGAQLNDQPLRPYRKGHGPVHADLNEPWKSDKHYTTTWHAETDAAAAMRRHGLDEAAVYLNIPTCGKESADPYRCDINLPKIIPRGAILYVWSVHEDGSMSRRKYEGTGEAIIDD
ncbi:DddA-like double-stranded DNA deaminase toxin [Salininema proteolyticum]|uniref:DddA-like double-stranded DNA deaminase toxin n=1 Tax=Salininema proteolyticum TaxID=1607685 RepID=A0ABV8TTH8_9ACTN